MGRARVKPTEEEPAAEGSHPKSRVLTLRFLEDGAISNAKIERFALFLVDRVPVGRAWVLAGYSDPDTSGGSRDWQRRVRAHPVFKERVRFLEAERDQAEAAVSPFAMARFTATQLWRDARSVGDVREASKAADLLFKIAEREVSYQGGGGSGLPGPIPAPPAASGHGPGAPATGATAARPKSIEELGRELIEKVE